MAHNLTPVSSNDIAIIAVPDPGDARTAASVGNPFQSVSNVLLYHQNHMPTLAGSSMHVPLTGGANDDIVALDGWYYTGGLWVQNNVSVAATLWVDLALPRGIVLNQVHLKVKGNGAGGGNHSAVPATKPTLTVYEQDPTNHNAILQTGGPVTDSSGTQAIYDAVHSIDITGLTWTVASDLRRYAVKITGEASTNALSLRLTLDSLQVVWSPV